jgi:hypothetical protein
MKKFLLLQILLIAFILISFELPSYGAGDFSKYYNKGIEFYKQGKYDQAGKEFEQAIEIKPNDVYALYGLGNTYYCKSKYDDAVKVYSKAININPDYAKVHYSLSLAYSKLGMTREAEKQKSIFRKLSQGGGGTSQKHAKSTPASTHSSAGHTPKKTLHESTHVATHDTGHESTHVDTHTTHAPSKHEDTHATHESKQATTHDTGHESKQADTHGSGGGSPSIFQGYDKTHKTDERVFKKKQHKKVAHGDYKNPFSSAKYFVQNKWHSSRIHKIWICAAGYIFATQAWLCVVAFFCVIIWRIRERD